MAGSEGAPSTSRGERVVAVIGFWWIPIVWFASLGAPRVHAVWKWATTFYAAYGLYECTATLSGKRRAWARNLTIARFSSLTLLVVAFVYMFATS